MPLEPPEDAATFLRSAQEFWTRVKHEKAKTPLPQGEWYPFDTLSGLSTVTELVSSDYAALARDIAGLPVADLGCADGDLGLLFASWGAEVDAIDYAPNNYNRMQGVAALSSALGLAIGIHDIDLDRDFQLPREVYGLALFLGTLYHLKNPYAVLERLAFQTRWCVLSTRIAQVTPSGLARVESEPVAYLADGREIANDATNFWIFSAAGLLRILQRTRWAIVASKRVGCLADSNPIDGNADERMFVLVKSRAHFPGLEVRLEDGWHAIEGSYRWTHKRFSLGIVLPLEKPFTGFSLDLFIAPALVASRQPLTVSCRIRDQVVGRSQYSESGPVDFSGHLPPFALHEPVLKLDFTVESEYSPAAGDARELGICVPIEPATGQVRFQLRNDPSRI